MVVVNCPARKLHRIEHGRHERRPTVLVPSRFNLTSNMAADANEGLDTRCAQPTKRDGINLVAQVTYSRNAENSRSGAGRRIIPHLIGVNDIDSLLAEN